MKNSWQILTLLLAVALLVLTIKVTFMSNETTEISIDPRDAALEAIMTRSSVRSYTTEPVSAEDIETILRAGMAAPTGGNKQPWEFVVVTDRDIIDVFPSIIPAAQMALKAPLVYVVCGVPSMGFPGVKSEYWIQDCSAVTENMLIAVNAMGLGAVWCGVWPNDESDRVTKIQKLLDLPDGVLPLNLIVVGHPDQEPVVKDKWKPEKIHYNKY